MKLRGLRIAHKHFSIQIRLISYRRQSDYLWNEWFLAENSVKITVTLKEIRENGNKWLRMASKPNSAKSIYWRVVLQMCCKRAAILLQIFGKPIFTSFHHIQYLLFCLHAKFHSSKAKTHVNSDFIAHHRQNVLNSRKYQKIRFLTYFHGSALKRHGVHKYFRVFFWQI